MILPTRHFDVKLRALAAVIAGIALTGCGGSESGEDSSSTSDIDISGTAIKGRMMNALVAAHPIVTGPDGMPTVREQPLGEPVRTGEAGAFSLSVPEDREGWVVLRLSVDGQTRMICDVPEGCSDPRTGRRRDFGQPVSLRADFTLSTAHDPQSNSDAHLSPLSDLALARARQSEQGLTEAGLGAAYRDTDEAFGLAPDTIRNTRPADLTALSGTADSAQAVRLAVTNAAFLAWADGTAGMTLSEVLTEARAQVQASGDLALQSEDGSAVNHLSLTEASADLVNALSAQAGEAASDVLDDSESWAVDRFEQTANEAGLITEPEPEVAADAAKLTWDAPLTRANGDKLKMGQIGGYELKYGQDPDNLAQSVDIADASQTQYLLENLEKGEWHFTVATYDTEGRLSKPSNAVSKVIETL